MAAAETHCAARRDHRHGGRLRGRRSRGRRLRPHPGRRRARRPTWPPCGGARARPLAGPGARARARPGRSPASHRHARRTRAPGGPADPGAGPRRRRGHRAGRLGTGAAGGRPAGGPPHRGHGERRTRERASSLRRSRTGAKENSGNERQLRHNSHLLRTGVIRSRTPRCSPCARASESGSSGDRVAHRTYAFSSRQPAGSVVGIRRQWSRRRGGSPDSGGNDRAISSSTESGS